MSVRRVRKALDAVRAADWWSYKIPPLLLTAYAGLAWFHLPLDALATVGWALLAILAIAVFGYVQNDICDVEADRHAGKPNRMTGMGRVGRVTWLAMPAALALLFALSTGDAVVVLLVGANLLMPTLYSVSPIRLKERGIWGALADAAGVHVLPMATVARAVTLMVPPTMARTVFVVTALGWAAFAGLRGIIVHQVVDRDADHAAGAETFGGRLGAIRARALIMRGLLPAELLSLVVFLALVATWMPVVWVVLGLYIAAETVKVRRKWTMPLFDHSGRTKEPYVPVVNNELYEVWLPTAFAVQLAILHPVLWLLVVGHLYLFLPNMRLRSAVTLKVLEPSP
jgi:4-hydroxybenzoate polyprenyltransferase